MTTIGERIRARRTELGLSQEELATKLGYKSRSSINKIELDQRNLTQKKIKAIADALDTTPDYIMGWDELDEILNPGGILATRVEIYELIVNEYGEDVAYAFSKFVDMDNDEAKKINELLDMYSRMDENDRAEVRGYILGVIEEKLRDEKYKKEFLAAAT